MFVGVQYLRAVAALAVVIYHLKPQLELAGLDTNAFEFGATGVDVFFIISGFVMWRTTRATPIGPLRFFERRLLRIAPLYWILTTVTLAVALVAPGAMQKGGVALPHVLASYLFWPALHPARAIMSPLLLAGWTLNYEMFFYAIFALTLLLPRGARLPTLVAALAALAAAHGFASADTAFEFYTRPLILEFAAGALIAATLDHAPAPPPAVCVASMAAGCLGLVLSPLVTWPDLVAGASAALLVAGAVFYEARRPAPAWPFMALLGDASYSLYLSHGIVLAAWGQVWRKLPFATTPWGVALFIVVGLGMAIAVGLALFRFVERPLGRRLRALLDLRRQRLAVADAAPATSA